ncbi:cupin domain-containing protein [Streptomyces sp. NPDC046727]|uniref:cupin domain-containing protein n=1 Tax=Streptomyces sp. NPDC046727 TaxID=3155373 RepID=UPI0033EA4812
MTITPGKIVLPGSVEPVRWTVEEGRFLLRGTDTGGLFSLMEFLTPPDGGPPLHLHENEDETFVVTSGAYEFRLGDKRYEGGPGTVVFGPRGTSHAFRNIAGTTSTMLCFATPGGAELMFEELIELRSREPRLAWQDILALAAKHRISYPEGPPPGRG